MNTTARIESNGASNRIHCSEETANLLIAAGKGHWVAAREDKIHAKGKGEVRNLTRPDLLLPIKHSTSSLLHASLPLFF